MGVMVSQITSLTIVYSTVYSGADQRKHQSSALLAFAGNSRVTDEFPTQRPVTRKMLPFDDVLMISTSKHNGRKQTYDNTPGALGFNMEESYMEGHLTP